MQAMVICVFDLVCQLFKRLDQDKVQTATANVRKDFHYSKVKVKVTAHTAQECLPPSRWTLYTNLFLLSPSRLGAAEETKGY